MSKRNVFILVLLSILVVCASLSFAQDQIPDLKGKWNGVSFLTAGPKGIRPSSHHINLMILEQSGCNFSGNIEIQENEITKMRNFSGSLNEHEGYIWYFSIVTEGGVLNIGYLITKNIMKVNLKTFNPNTEIVICRLTRDKAAFE